MAKVIMVQGTMSSAGKSLLVAGLCRIFMQDGYKVAPFKSQNMALNSFVTRDGLEMGRAQVMQAECAGIEPSVYMNPILLKPTTDCGSQVIVNGRAIGNMPAKEYFGFKKSLIPDIKKAFDVLSEQYDIIVIEGAGSPAEINLKENDIVNMGLAKLVNAPVLLVGDIDRGGVFAQLLGTLMLLEEDEKKLIKGLVINKFRGDKSILDSGISMLEEKGGIPVTGVIPYINIQVDDEDSLSERLGEKSTGLINIAVVRLPKISNYTDFNVFETIPGVKVSYVTNHKELEKADLVILPGSKNTIADLIWLRESGLEAAIKHFAQDSPVIGVCGGFQMLGKSIEDPQNVEGGGAVRGLELLDIVTVLKNTKQTTQRTGQFGRLEGFFDCISELKYEGYEIHMGVTVKADSLRTDSEKMDLGESDIKKQDFENTTEQLIDFQAGNVFGTYVHGVFDAGDIAKKIVEKLAAKKGVELENITEADYKKYKEKQYDILADEVRNHMDMKAVYEMINAAAGE